MLILEYAFRTLGLESVWCGTSSNNIPMQKLACKLGMKHEGVQRKQQFKNGEFVDRFLYSILKEEYGRRNISTKSGS